MSGVSQGTATPACSHGRAFTSEQNSVDTYLPTDYRGHMAVLRPREIASRAVLWRDNGGRPWLVVLQFTMVAGRLECVGMEIRSFLHEDAYEDVEVPDERDPKDGLPSGIYPAYWGGELEASSLPLDDGYSVLAWNLADRHVAAEDLTVSGPHPLRATTLRQLPLADVSTRMRRQQNVPSNEWPAVAVTDLLGWAQEVDGPFSDWWKEHKAAWAPKMRRGGRVAKYSQSDLEQVAAIYSEAYESGSNSPTKDVAEQLAITRNQAAKLVMKCRKGGLLGPVPWATAGGTLGESRTRDQQHRRASRRRSSENEGGSDDDGL